MAALQKFRLLARQCGVAPSPTRSPRSSPLLHLTRSTPSPPPQKTTLRMLLTRGAGTGRRRNSTGDRDLFVPCSTEMCENKKMKMKKDRDTSSSSSSAARQKLKDLFGSSPLPEDDNGELEKNKAAKHRPVILVGGGMKSGVIININSSSSPRPPGFVGRLRYRALLKKSWRPPLETIPE